MKGVQDLGVLPQRRLNGRSRPAPHLSLKFDEHLFSIDSSRAPIKDRQPDIYLITHAHSDHYGKSAMLSPRSLASRETARALEIRYERTYRGRTFQVGESVDVEGVEVKTYPTGHTIGSTAFFWKNEVGTKILVTGDVKDYSALPKADLLVSEANYGDPWDPSCRFDDDLAGFWEALCEGATFGAYAFGKAQRAVALIRGMGYQEEIGMDEQSLALTQELMPKAQPLKAIDGSGTNVVSPWDLPRAPGKNKFLLTGRNGGSYPTIRLSDHLDFRGLMRMYEHVSPQAAIVYHPEGTRSRLLAHHLRQCGMVAVALEEVQGAGTIEALDETT